MFLDVLMHLSMVSPRGGNCHKNTFPGLGIWKVCVAQRSGRWLMGIEVPNTMQNVPSNLTFWHICIDQCNEFIFTIFSDLFYNNFSSLRYKLMDRFFCMLASMWFGCGLNCVKFVLLIWFFSCLIKLFWYFMEFPLDRGVSMEILAPGWKNWPNPPPPPWGKPLTGD